MNGGFHVMKKEWGTVHLDVNRSPLTIVELKFGFAELKVLHGNAVRIAKFGFLGVSACILESELFELLQRLILQGNKRAVRILVDTHAATLARPSFSALLLGTGSQEHYSNCQ